MSSVRYDMNRRRSKLWLAWVLFGMTLLATAAMYALMGAGCRELLAGEILTERFAPFVFSISNVLFGLLGVLIHYRHPGHPIGWLCAIIGVLGGIQFYTWVHSACLVLPLPAMDAAAWMLISLHR